MGNPAQFNKNSMRPSWSRGASRSSQKGCRSSHLLAAPTSGVLHQRCQGGIAMRRRDLMMLMGGLPLMSTAQAQDAKGFRRNRPGDPGWPSDSAWQALKAEVGGRLVKLRSPFDACQAAPTSSECSALFTSLKNPSAIGDDPALTQTAAWAGAWASAASAYAVAAESATDVAAALAFARQRRL